jgi:hypothetical protein
VKTHEQLRFVQVTVPVHILPWNLDFMLMQCMYVCNLVSLEHFTAPKHRLSTFRHDSILQCPATTMTLSGSLNLDFKTPLSCDIFVSNHEKSHREVLTALELLYLTSSPPLSGGVSDAGKTCRKCPSSETKRKRRQILQENQTSKSQFADQQYA